MKAYTQSQSQIVTDTPNIGNLHTVKGDSPTVWPSEVAQSEALVQIAIVVIPVSCPAATGSNHHLLTKGSEGFSNKFFVCERTINFSGIEKRNTVFDG